MKVCLYCNKSNVKLYPLKDWDDDSKEKHYCKKHYTIVKANDEEQKRRFWEYYRGSVELRNECLSEKSKQLWEKINKEFVEN